MRHATVQAIRVLSGVDPALAGWRAPDVFACTWESVPASESISHHFGSGKARDLLADTPVALPTCQTCAVFVDLALGLRGSTQDGG